MDCSPPGFSVHGNFRARILEWVAIPFSRGTSQHRDRTQVSCIAGWCFTIWATREADVCLKVVLENEGWLGRSIREHFVMMELLSLSLPFFFFLLAKPCIMWNFSFPTDQGSIWCSLQWKHRALTTDLQGVPSVMSPEYCDNVCVVCVLSCSVVSNSLWPHGL